MSANRDRAEAVAKLLNDYEAVDTEFVMKRLRCGRGQAQRAIRQGRALAAHDGFLVSYANPSNAFTVTADGDPVDRDRSWLARLKSINTQKKNAAQVMGAASVRLDASPHDRVLAKLAEAAGKDAEAEKIRLEAIKDLLKMEGGN